MKSFFFRLILLILPAAIMVVAVNYIIDPANIFRPGAYEKKIANALLKGHNVDSLYNYNERLLQKEMVSGISYTPDVVVVGSSRVMEISSSFFENKKLLNCGVSHATLNDLICIVGLLDSMNKLPKKIVLEVNPMFMSLMGTTEWKALSPFHDYAVRNILQNVNTEDEFGKTQLRTKLSALFSFEYFQIASKILFKGEHRKAVDIEKRTPKQYGRFADGTVNYDPAYKSIDSVKTTTDVDVFITKNKLPKSDTSAGDKFVHIIKYLKRKGCEVNLIMLPFHPVYFDIFNAQNKLLDNSEAYFHQLAIEQNVKLFGTFNPSTHQLYKKHFYDAFHCTKEALNIIFPNQILNN